jgi:hypothetical protein
MADPRLDVSVVGIGENCLTAKGDGSTVNYSATANGGSTAVGLAVNFSAAGTVQLVADGEAVVGKLIKVDSDDIATVQYRGGMTLPGGSGASLTLNNAIVGALGAESAEGYIRDAASGTAAELVLARGFICDAGTTTAVEVMLD